VSDLVRRTGTRAVTLEYRLAPEHPYPAAVDDARAAYEGLLAQGIAPGQIALAGESAGGGLAVALLLALREAGLPLPSSAYLLSPYVDLTLSERHSPRSGRSTGPHKNNPMASRLGFRTT
jgi:acetyl esterase/lipase